MAEDRTPSALSPAEREENALDCVLAELERLPSERARLRILLRAFKWHLDGCESEDLNV